MNKYSMILPCALLWHISERSQNGCEWSKWFGICHNKQNIHNMHIVLNTLILSVELLIEFYYYSHITDEETEP